MSNLFNIEQRFLKVFRELEDLEGESTPELEEELAIAEYELEDKLTAYHYVIRHAKADIDLIDDEIKRLQGIKAAKSNSIKRLKNVMLDAVKLFGVTTKSGGKQLKYLTVNMYTGTTKALILEDDFVNENYTTYANVLTPFEIKLLESQMEDIDYKLIPVIDKKTLKSDIDGGKVVEGAEVIRNIHLVIR